MKFSTHTLEDEDRVLFLSIGSIPLSMTVKASLRDQYYGIILLTLQFNVDE